MFKFVSMLSMTQYISEEKYLFFYHCSSFTQTRDDLISYLYWVVCFSGAFVLVTAAIHAALWKPISSIVGAVVSSILLLQILFKLPVPVFLSDCMREFQRQYCLVEMQFP